jgi:hypothetical protein
MKKIANLLKTLVLGSLLIPTFLIGEEEHIPVGTRPTSQTAIQTEEEECKQEAQCGFIFDRYSPSVYYSFSYHLLTSVMLDANGEPSTIALEDGSNWRVHSSDGYKALNWSSQDPLIITQNHRWFATFPYKIINKNTGNSIEAELKMGPFSGGVYTYYVADMDPIQGEALLTNGSRWEISSRDLSTFREWAIEDCIMFGTNSGGDSSYDTLLINVTMNNNVRAKQY